MKKTILNLIVALIFVSASTFASNIPSITTVDAKSIIVDTKEWKSEFVSVQFRNDERVVIFEEKYSTQKGKKFSFENLPNGQYSIVLSNDYKSTEQFFTLNSNRVVVQPNTVTVFKPIVNVNEDFIDLNYLAPGKNTSVSISDDNNTFFDFEFKNEKNINKRFDTSTLPSGTYTIHVYSKNSSYSKTFHK
jgi:outer membrane lipoprotein-sorting protein